MGANNFMQSPFYCIIALHSIAYFHSALPLPSTPPARIKSSFLEWSGVPETSRNLGQGLMTVAAVVHGMAVLRCI